MNEFKSYFGFITEPFSKEIKAGSIFLSKQLKSIIQKLTHLIHRRGIALITGDVGSGKTTVIRNFAEALDISQFDVVYIDDPTIGLRGIFNQIARQLNLDTKYFKWQLMPGLKQAINKNFKDYRKTTLVVIDDAQLIKPKDLDEIRLFTNFNFDACSPLTLVLLAQPEFRKIIQLKSLEALSQRIILRVYLTGLQQDEIKLYVKHQLEIAGRSDELFSDDVIAEIYQHARGIPRVINEICYQCLMECFIANKNLVDLTSLEKVLLEYDI